MVNKCKKYRYIFQEKAKLHNLPNARIIYLDNGLLSSLEKQFDRFQMKHQKIFFIFTSVFKFFFNYRYAFITAQLHFYMKPRKTFEKMFFTLSTYFWNATNDIID